jgi:hypothetical protein
MANPGKKLTGPGALYLYGISSAPGAKGAARPGAKPAKIGSGGIDGLHAVKPVECGEFVCWVSEVDSKTFPQDLERNRENLEWLALHGVRHQQVVGELAGQMAVVPARFGTIFSAETALVEDVLRRKAALHKVFTRIAGGEEWGVKVFAERKAAAAPPASVKTGREYLQLKASRMQQRPERNDDELHEFAAALEAVATGSAPSGKVSGVQPSLLWQATFLVPRAQRKRWNQVLRRFVERWEGRRRIEVNGPWPPYSFVSDAD